MSAFADAIDDLFADPNMAEGIKAAEDAVTAGIRQAAERWASALPELIVRNWRE